MACEKFSQFFLISSKNDFLTSYISKLLVFQLTKKKFIYNFSHFDEFFLSQTLQTSINQFIQFFLDLQYQLLCAFSYRAKRHVRLQFCVCGFFVTLNIAYYFAFKLCTNSTKYGSTENSALYRTAIRHYIKY